MSIRVMSAVWEYSTHKGAALLLMLAIADHASDDGTNAYPSVRRLAQRTRLSERTVQRTIQECESSGELVVNRPDVREHRSNYYTIRLDRLPMGVTSDTHVRMAPMPKRPVMGDSAVTRTVPLEPSEVSSTRDEAEERWNAALEKIQTAGITTGNLSLFEGTQGLRLERGVLVVSVPDRGTLRTLSERWGGLVERAAGMGVRFEGGGLGGQ